MNTNIFIPTKINVGFQERKDTYYLKNGYLEKRYYYGTEK